MNWTAPFFYLSLKKYMYVRPPYVLFCYDRLYQVVLGCFICSMFTFTGEVGEQGNVDNVFDVMDCDASLFRVSYC